MWLSAANMLQKCSRNCITAMNCPNCHHAIDPSAIPDDVLASERGRRNQAKRTTITVPRNGGRKPTPTPCPRCGEIQPSAKASNLHCRV